MHGYVTKGDSIYCTHEGRPFVFSRACILADSETIGTYKIGDRTYGVSRKSLYGNIFMADAAAEITKIQLNETRLQDIVFQTYMFLNKRSASTMLEIQTKQMLRNCIEAHGTENQKKEL
jgi:hypothetical protein